MPARGLAQLAETEHRGLRSPLIVSFSSKYLEVVRPWVPMVEGSTVRYPQTPMSGLKAKAIVPLVTRTSCAVSSTSYAEPFSNSGAVISSAMLSSSSLITLGNRSGDFLPKSENLQPGNLAMHACATDRACCCLLLASRRRRAAST